MKRTLTLLAAAAVFALPFGAGAAEKKAATKAADAVKEGAAKVAGELKAMPFSARADAIDAKGSSFTMKRKDGVEVKNVVTAKTAIKNGEAAAKFGDIKVGDYVSGTRLKKSDTEYEVVKITKFSAEAPKRKAAGDAKPAEKKAN
jgi:hypothetical protein